MRTNTHERCCAPNEHKTLAHALAVLFWNNKQNPPTVPCPLHSSSSLAHTFFGLIFPLLTARHIAHDSSPSPNKPVELPGLLLAIPGLDAALFHSRPPNPFVVNEHRHLPLDVKFGKTNIYYIIYIYPTLEAAKKSPSSSCFRCSFQLTTELVHILSRRLCHRTLQHIEEQQLWHCNWNDFNPFNVQRNTGSASAPELSLCRSRVLLCHWLTTSHSSICCVHGTCCLIIVNPEGVPDPQIDCKTFCR